VPDLPHDGLPDAPDIDEDVDMVQGKPQGGTTLALHAGPGPAPAAAIPASPAPAYSAPPAPAPVARAYAPLPPAPIGGSLREDGAFVPEGKPADWDQTSSIARQ